MLTLIILLAATQQAAPSMITPAPSPPPGAGAMPLLGQTPGWVTLPQLANEPTTGGDLMWRDAGQAVGHYLLLDRYVGGCPEPIIVNYRVPGSNAVGREVARQPRPTAPAPRAP